MNFFTLTFRALGRNHIASTQGLLDDEAFGYRMQSICSRSEHNVCVFRVFRRTRVIPPEFTIEPFRTFDCDATGEIQIPIGATPQNASGVPWVAVSPPRSVRGGVCPLPGGPNLLPFAIFRVLDTPTARSLGSQSPFDEELAYIGDIQKKAPTTHPTPTGGDSLKAYPVEPEKRSSNNMII